MKLDCVDIKIKIYIKHESKKAQKNYQGKWNLYQSFQCENSKYFFNVRANNNRL